MTNRSVDLNTLPEGAILCAGITVLDADDQPFTSRILFRHALPGEEEPWTPQIVQAPGVDPIYYSLDNLDDPVVAYVLDPRSLPGVDGVSFLRAADFLRAFAHIVGQPVAESIEDYPKPWSLESLPPESSEQPRIMDANGVPVPGKFLNLAMLEAFNSKA